MPVKLPAPLFGTDEQPGPKSLAAVAAFDEDVIGEDDALAGEAGADAVEDPDELHAAVARPRLAMRPTEARRRYFMVFSLVDSVGELQLVWSDLICGAVT
jgi:hypothetical protein